MTIWISVISSVIISLSVSETIDISKDICGRMCCCEDREGILIISCENRGIVSLSEVELLDFTVHQLFLTGNLLRKLSSNDFFRYTGLQILHLGNNSIAEIEPGAFNRLSGLQRLHLNNNKIRALMDDTFDGLERLVYLQLDFNYISHIEPNTFNRLRHLEVLILNNNLLSILPKNIFYFVPLTHLDLRENKLKALFYKDLLLHLSKIVEILLDNNPWNCSCEIISLKDWLESMSLAGNLVCEMPLRLQGSNLFQVSKQELCSKRAVGEYKINAEAFRKPKAVMSNIVHSTQPTKSSQQLGKLRIKPSLTVSFSKSQNYGQIMVYQTKSPVSPDCPSVCNCNPQISDFGLNVNCQERKLEHISDLNPKPHNPKKIYLTGNVIATVYSSDFLGTTSLDLLHLGNNQISVVQSKAFADLRKLRRLYLNGNLLERLFAYMFCGLENLQFLYLEYNLIKEIKSGTFEQLPNLQLLFLNNNFLKVLPIGVFAGVTLVQLNLRNNQLQNLPVSGVLEDLTSLVQIDLFENPWDCSCSNLEMMKWLKDLKAESVVNGVICKSPTQMTGEDIRHVHLSYLCSDKFDVNASEILPSEESFPGSPITLEMAQDYDSPNSAVPLSVFILSLLLIFIASVFIAAGLFTMPTLTARKKNHANIQSNYNDTSEIRNSEGHIYEYVSPAILQSQSYVIEKERYKDFEELNDTLASTSDEELGSMVNSTEFSTINRQSPLPDEKLSYRDVLARHHQASTRFSLPCKHDTTPYLSSFNVLHQCLHPEMLQQTEMCVEPKQNEYWELKNF
ncbi:SLIT and NTRK-like protein 5 [Trichomycterus rosablanca]|uniref:SLIT and NTRK-like protein 5 n=1 Tax=Trichomycterus rosablanca TaxID=2290929 RepID=UPI002F354C02